jgi:predicted  nucleic acid-binding Zn-ribbon protein
MAQDWRSEFMRPLPMSLAALAAVGWLVVLIVLVAGATERSELRADYEASEAARAALQDELDQRRRSAARLEDIAAEVESREQVLADIAASQNAAQAELAAIESEIATNRTTLDDQAAAARDAEAESSRLQAEAAKAAEQSAAQKAALDEAIAGLQASRDQLAADVASAEAHRAALQTEITDLAATLAARGEELAALERRVGDLQATSVEASGLSGIYRSERLSVTFNDDGTFRMSDLDGRRVVTGRYEREGGSLRLLDATGDTGDAKFPLRCSLSQVEAGFTFDRMPECGPLAGLTFAR